MQNKSLKSSVSVILAIACIACSGFIAESKELYRRSNNEVTFKVNTPKEVRASHLLVSTKEEAEALRQEIINGRDFAEVAKEVSKCPSGARGGDLGFFGRGRMVPEFDQAAFNLPVGELSEPIQTQFGWHLLVVTEQK